MKYSVSSPGNGMAVIAAEGKLNMVSADSLRALLSTTVHEGKNRLTIDMAGVDFIDSSGLGALISGLKLARLAGGDLRIAAPTDQVKLVLQLTNMERVLTSYERPELAYANG